MSSPRTAKGERSRQHLVDCAMARFERDGFGKTSMRAIAEDAGVAVGLAYRYFDAKESIVLAYYEQVARTLLDRPVEGATLGARFQCVMRTKLALLAPRRRAMGSMIAAMLDPDGPVGLLSPPTREVRETTRQALRVAVSGAAGVPADQVEVLVALAWLGQILLLLAWVQRPLAAELLVGQVAGALDLLVPFLGLPPVRSGLEAAARAVEAFTASA